ncbi:G-protein coupled receptor GRL101-like isoform X2 [Acropora millepora]|uniref:G-protein coupled receptor GRL101-like isoform X2 n=1 Tax=Acropora millepora TaxID=45264 RepID=UPI001CF4E97C|nr:G-protein coupled receptor GRL101-like isoform X2 [Acropora millepora]
MSVFKLYFSSEKLDAGRKDCIQLKDCPSSCVCFPVSSKSQDMVVTVEEGKEVIYIPKTFPTNTTAIFFQGNKIWYIEKTSFSGLLKLKYLDLSRNHIFRVDDGAFYSTMALETLKLDMNFITTLPDSTFGKLENLQILDCSFNLIREIPSSALASLFQLTTLSLRSNRISKIEKNAFYYSRNLIYLYLQGNEIEELANEGFHGLSRLKILDISKNRIKRLFSNTFAGLSSLEILKMRNNLLSLKRIPFDAFYGLRNLKKIYVDESILCCYAGGADSGGSCLSPTHQLPLTKNEFSDCSDLMKNRGVQVCVWILGLTALLGNLLVILMRVVVKEDNKVHSFLLTNLAMSDLLMGIYLLIIAMKDLQWQGVYFAHDYKWRSGVPCAVTGVLSMLSSEVSVLMLTVITTDRLICIVFPFKVRRMNRSVALAVVGGVWVFGVMLSVIPILGLEYFYDKKHSVGFYGKSAVCLPLQLSSERMAGWEYAAGIFIGLNFVSFVYILVAYIVMFITVKNSSKKVRSTNLKRESQMARRMFFIILTDFLCWMPVILIGLLSLLGKFHDPERQAYIWIAVFVLPVNSSINPFLYTFSTPDVRRKVGGMKNSLFSFIATKLRRRKEENVPRNRMKSSFWRNIPCPSVFGADHPASSSSNHRSRHNPGTSSKTLQEVQEHGSEKGLKIVNTASILPKETSDLVGFVVACRQNGKETAMRLIKHFSSECEDDWEKESGLVNVLGETEHPNILTYCWHCKAQECVLNFKQTLFPRLGKSAFLLCYDFPESTPLDEYLKNKKIVLNLDTLFVLAVDLIDAIQCLENRGIVHNNITTSTVLIAEGLRVPPVKAILAGFGSSQFVSRDFADCKEIGRTKKDILGKNIVQFGSVLSELMRSCYDSRESDELQGIVHLCSEQDVDVRPSASQIGDLLRDLCHQNDIWDTPV